MTRYDNQDTWRRHSARISLIIPLLLAQSCQVSPEYPAIAVVESRVLFTTPDGVNVLNGGYGSSLAFLREKPDVFYLLTDRGPNADTANADEKAFLLPSFAPHIGVFKLDGTTLSKIGSIEIKDANGKKLSGLPAINDRADGLENAVDPRGKPLPRDGNGIDPEGMVAVKDGTFWISDEYGPYVLHVDASGKITQRISPFGKNAVGHSLPGVLARRRPNYGLEGLTLTPDGTTLVGILQSALDNPDRSVRSTRTTRLFFLNLVAGQTKQFVYLREQPEFSVTDITALSATEFLVLERDDNFPADPKSPGRNKRVYRIDISRATDVSDEADSVAGKLFGGKTLEQLSDVEIRSAQINAAAKTLVADLVALPEGYPHDKPEGLAVIADGVIAVSNDDDFGIDDATGSLVQKKDPGTGQRDKNQIYFIHLSK
jgi:hypothetical protein